MHNSFEENGSNIAVVIVAQKEPHAGSLAFKDISQPETVAERTELAKRMKDEFELPMPVLVDSMKDTSRALFTDLPSPAFIIDEKGILRSKMPWAQSHEISTFLENMNSGEENTPKEAESPDAEAPETSDTPETFDTPEISDTPDTINKSAKTNFSYEPQTKWVTLSVSNPEGSALSLQRVEFDEVETVLNLGNAKQLEVKVASGYYVLSMEDETGSDKNCRWPVPADARFTETLDIEVSTYEVPKNLRGQWSFIPGGPTLVGDSIGLGRDEERPVRMENVEAFLIGRYEVSNRQYADFLNEQVDIPHEWLDLESKKCLIEGDEHSAYSTPSPKMPVVMVSREGALQYCQWLTKKTGVVHRLATEAEWERAARGPESFLYAYGNVCRIAAANQESGHLRDSGDFAPNGYGLYDMTGNCFEWVSGQFETSTKLTGLLRGGSFIFDGIYNRNSFRMRQAPTVMTDDIGFRVVREIKNNEPTK